ncbi:N-6 DNA methylase [Gluconobacter japonicus]|uniref:HsdM family class I SAM-dependent methyltransferase n=1 Tax=Gluconobacter oxydans TaxID=442 RepID=UPI000795E4CA|nr:N-6 DNA methylase [Gluconobacter japonicus]
MELSMVRAIDGMAHGANPSEGFVSVAGYDKLGRPPAEVVVMEMASEYGADAVFFEADTPMQQGTAQAFVFLSDGPANDPAFAALHKRLWSWGGVPLLYRHTPGLVQLFRCRHKPDFLDADGNLICKPVKVLKLTGRIAKAQAWWSAERLYNGTVWDDVDTERLLLSRESAAHRALIRAVETLHERLKKSDLQVDVALARRLLILSLLIAYLAERGALPEGYFGTFLEGASTFGEVLAKGPELVKLLEDLELKFNGGVFTLEDAHKVSLTGGLDLGEFRRLIEAREDGNGQLSFWRSYSFKDLPVELISHIYQLFVSNTKSSVYTPPALVRLLLDESLSWSRLDRLVEKDEVIFDPACGSGIFLVEAYKRLILHWRSRNQWSRPTPEVLRSLAQRVCGTDLEKGAVELAAFSLSLALCDELTTEQILKSRKLFPELIQKTIFHSCFFEFQQAETFPRKVGVIVGNPPFASTLDTPGAVKSCETYNKHHKALPDKQVAFLFLQDSMKMLAPGGILCMIQQYNFLYNSGAASFRESFFAEWDVREILDFVSIRGLFDAADTKAVAVIAEASAIPADRKILHAVFRRTPRARADLRFEVDYYDLHWLPRSEVLKDSSVIRWRSGLLGGARVLAVTRRLKRYPTLQNFADRNGWRYGEGFIQGSSGISRAADHIIGKRFVPSEALTSQGIDENRISIMPRRPIQVPRTAPIFQHPLLLIREHMDLQNAVWESSPLTYPDQIIGFSGTDPKPLHKVSNWLRKNSSVLQGFVAANSAKLFTKKATAIACSDVYDLPFPEDGDLDLSENETIVLKDIAAYYRDFLRRGFDSAAGKAAGDLTGFSHLLCEQVNAVYSDNPLRPLAPQRWPGIICQVFTFGKGVVDWEGHEELADHLKSILHAKQGASLSMTRIARIYDGRNVFLIKPDRERYWLQSVALRDADDLLADLRAQGF